VAYIQKIKEDFQDKSIFHAWETLRLRLLGEYRTLVHPNIIPKDDVRELMPYSFNVDDILNLTIQKQKEIASRLNISKLPSDRPSGMLGQSALFEVLMYEGFDFKSYVDGFYKKWEHSQTEGYVLLFVLGYIYYIRRFFDYPHIDLVKLLVEPITTHQLALTWDANWVTRILMNSAKLIPNNLTKKQMHQILRNLMCIQDGRGMTVSRVMEWTGESRTRAYHLMDILKSSWFEHRYRIVSKNTGTVKVLTKSKTSRKIMPSFHSSCTSYLDNDNYFISISDLLKEDAKGKYFEMEAWNTNIDLYDQNDQKWNLNPSDYDAKSIDDIHALLQNGDHTLPDNSIPPTRRDLLFIALLTGWDTSHYPSKKQETIQTRGRKSSSG